MHMQDKEFWTGRMPAALESNNSVASRHSVLCKDTKATTLLRSVPCGAAPP